MLLPTLLSKIRARFPVLDGASIRRGLRHAFSTGTSQGNKALNEKELVLITKLIAVVQRRRLTIPASMFLECMQPLNYIGSQAMAFFRPFLTFFFTPAEYDLFQGILEKREGIQRVIEELEKVAGKRKEVKEE